MPTYRTSLTIIAAGLMAVGTAAARDDQADAFSVPAAVADRSGSITVEESVGPTPSLRQSLRLAPLRFAPDLPVAADQTSVPAGVPSLPVNERAVASAEPSAGKSASLADILADSSGAPARLAEPPATVLASAVPAPAEPAVERVVDRVAGRSVEHVGGAPVGDQLAAAPSPAAPALMPVSSASAEDAMVRLAYTPGQTPVATQSDVPRAAPQKSVPVTVYLAANDVPPLDRYQRPSAVPVSDLSASSAAAVPVAVSQPVQVGAVAVATPVQESTPQAWTLARDDRTVRSALSRWSRQMDWQLSWEFPTDFQIEFNADFEGDFIEAVARVVEGLSVPERPVRAEFYKGNRVLRILSGRQ